MTRMSQPSALSNGGGTLIKVLDFSDNFRSIKADLYNLKETTEGPCGSKRLTFIMQSHIGYKYETKRFHHSLFTWYKSEF